MEGGGDNVVPIGAAIDKAAFGAAAKAARKKGPPPPPRPRHPAADMFRRPSCRTTRR
jgi:hypothetical protein